MGRIGLETSVGALVAESMGRARVFERLGIDYCCGGGQSLAQACARGSLDPAGVIAELEADDAAVAAREGDDSVDYRAWSPGALADHIVVTHHAYLDRELPRLAALVDKVAEVHGARHPELAELRQVFHALRAELTDHLMKEERILFPLVKRLEAAEAAFPMHCGTVNNPIRVMEHEHDDAGTALARLRTLTNGYRAPADGCSTFQALYDGLATFETDMHRHIHKENNILFPMAAAMEERLSVSAG